MPYVNRPDARVYYETFRCRSANAAGPLVFVPGLAANARSFPWTISELTKTHDVFALDPRGAGLTRASGRFALRDIADDVAAVIAHAGLDRPPVLGISMGGMITQHLAIRHPDAVGRIILTCTTPGRSGKRASWRTIGRLFGGLIRPPMPPTPEGLAETFGPILFSPDTRFDRRVRFFADRAQAGRPDRRGIARQIDAIRRHETGRKLRRIQHPALVITGVDDVLVPPVNSEILARKIPNAQLERMPGGHVLFYENAAPFVDAVRRFIR